MKALKILVLVFGLALMTQRLTAEPFAPCDSVPGNIVANCGFESGNFIPWSPGGVITNTQVAEGPGFGYSGPNSGLYYFVMGSVGPGGTLSQTLPTYAGYTYTFAFYFASLGDTPSSFSAYWDNTQLLSLVDPNSGGAYVLYQYQVAAVGDDTIQFDFEDTPGWMALDDVSVTGTPEPGTLSLLFVGLGAGLVFVWRLRSLA